MSAVLQAGYGKQLWNLLMKQTKAEVHKQPK